MIHAESLVVDNLTGRIRRVKRIEVEEADSRVVPAWYGLEATPVDMLDDEYLLVEIGKLAWRQPFEVGEVQ